MSSIRIILRCSSPNQLQRLGLTLNLHLILLFLIWDLYWGIGSPVACSYFYPLVRTSTWFFKLLRKFKTSFTFNQIIHAIFLIDVVLILSCHYKLLPLIQDQKLCILPRKIHIFCYGFIMLLGMCNCAYSLLWYYNQLF